MIRIAARAAIVATMLMVLLLAGRQPETFAQAQDAQELSVDAIVETTNRVAYYQGSDGRARVSMVITDAQGRTRNRIFTILRFDEPDPQPKDAQTGPADQDSYCGDQKFYVYFYLPADVNKMAFMVWKHLTADDDRWLYLPAVGLVKRIASGDKRTSFVGSDFFYEDVSGRNITADVHELIETRDNFYVLKNTPRKPEDVEFSYYIMWIHRKTFIPIKIEYFDAKDKMYRVYEALQVETIQGYPTVVKARMSDLSAKTQTEITYSGVKYNVGIPEDVFTERYLHRPPQEYLR